VNRHQCALLEAVGLSVEIRRNRASAAAAARYPVGATYAALPSGCAYAPRGQYPFYSCGAGPAVYWLAPAYGANVVFYQVVAAP